ncbi:MAG: alkaline phosphatase family protein [Bacteroidota bacterium]
MKKIAVILFLIVVSAFSKTPAPKLVVFISIDQMRADYFERYAPLFTGGFHRLYSQGIVYTNTDLNYATSETGPGHATLGTGCYPAHSGIHSNEWIDPQTKKTIYCVEDSLAKQVDGDGGGFSARNLVAPAIGDWLKAGSKNSKVVSVSSKDRAAILMGGKAPDYVFWYSRKNGAMMTSDYYMKTLPQWAKDFNASGWIDKNVPEAWTKSLPDSAFAALGPDNFIAEPQTNGSSAFPHPFTPGKKADQIMGTPYGDKFVIDFAISAVQGEKLGQRNTTDVLCMSLSNCDYVGHGYGPDSHEQLELLTAVDKGLGKFFEALDAAVGKDKYIVALSADHAVCPLPEYNVQFRNIPAKRYIYSEEIKPKLDSLSSLLKYEMNSSEDVIIKNSFINYAVAQKNGWDSLKIELELTKRLLSIDAFVDVYFRHEMMGTAPSTKPFMQKFRNSYFAPRGEDFHYLIREHCIISSKKTGTTHGTPYSYDTHVPLIFWWNTAVPKKITREVHSADAAPTLAKFAGFTAPKTLDGVPLKEVIR